MTVDIESRWARALTLKPSHGSHTKSGNGEPPNAACIVELYAWVAGAPWSDAPDCICPSIRNVLVRFNDRCGYGAEADARRARVFAALGLVPLNTRSASDVQQRRIWLAADWSYRVAVPRLLRAANVKDWPDKLESLAPIRSTSDLEAARYVLYSSRDACWKTSEEAWKRLRAVAAAAADAVAAADAAAVAAADAAAEPKKFKKIVDAAVKAKAAGGGYSEQYAAARKVADAVYADRASVFRALRDELDDGLVDLVKRMAALKE